MQIAVLVISLVLMLLVGQYGGFMAFLGVLVATQESPLTDFAT
jgi:hypothetical protein